MLRRPVESAAISGRTARSEHVHSERLLSAISRHWLTVNVTLKPPHIGASRAYLEDVTAAEFSQSIAIDSGSFNTYTESVTKLTMDILGNISIVVSYTIKTNSDVPAGTVNTDTLTAVALEYAF